MSGPIFDVIAASAGAVVGWSTSRVLRRGPRPVTVPVVACAVGTGLLWLLVVWRWESGGVPAWWLPVPLVVTAPAVALTLADLGHRRLPDALTLPAYPLIAAAMTVAAIAGPATGLLVDAAVGALLVGGVHALVHTLAPASLGAGDVKLSGSLGAVLGTVGWPALVIAACLAAATTLGLALVAVVLRVRHWRAGVPHGPGLLAATCLVAVFPGAGLGVVGMGS